MDPVHAHLCSPCSRLGVYICRDRHKYNAVYMCIPAFHAAALGVQGYCYHFNGHITGFCAQQGATLEITLLCVVGSFPCLYTCAEGITRSHSPLFVSLKN